MNNVICLNHYRNSQSLRHELIREYKNKLVWMSPEKLAAEKLALATSIKAMNGFVDLRTKIKVELFLEVANDL